MAAPTPRRSVRPRRPIGLVRLADRARLLGIHVETWTPGDGVTRYRFWATAADADVKDPVFTALGRREAHVFMDGVSVTRNGLLGQTKRS